MGKLSERLARGDDPRRLQDGAEKAGKIALTAVTIAGKVLWALLPLGIWAIAGLVAWKFLSMLGVMLQSVSGGVM